MLAGRFHHLLKEGGSHDIDWRCAGPIDELDICLKTADCSQTLAGRHTEYLLKCLSTEFCASQHTLENS